METPTPCIDEQALAEIAQNCLCLQVRQTARIITQWYDECLQPDGFRSTQLSVLAAIALAHAVPLTRLAEILVLDRTTLARNLKPLERQGLVRVQSGADRRVHLISLTEHGYAFLAQALPSWRKAQEEAMVRLGSSHWQTLRADLQSVTRHIP